MRIYTSYFGNVKQLQRSNVELVGIARYKPRYYSGFNLTDVAPKAFMLSDDMTQEEYVSHYEKLVLEPLDVKAFLKTLERISGGKDVALCCYEKPGQFCHRHLLAKWLNEKANLDIKEFGVKEETVEKEAEMLTLF